MFFSSRKSEQSREGEGIEVVRTKKDRFRIGDNKTIRDWTSD